VLKEFEFKSLVMRLKEVLTPQSASGSQLPLAGEQPELEITVPKETQIAFWLLNSEVTNPTADDIFTYTKTKNLNEAQKVLDQEIKNNKLEFIYNSIELPLVPVFNGHATTRCTS
jgi:hypothetical protein